MQYLKYLPYLIMIAAIYYVINANLDSIQNKKKNALKYVLNNKSKDSKFITYLKKKDYISGLALIRLFMRVKNSIGI
ncbi:hypothetical protein LQK80_00895 [Bacillus thuringiensis]|nr:hypothetical protein [Bacillus thuringiensis]